METVERRRRRPVLCEAEEASGMGGDGDGFGFFTEAELAAADQLVQLSASGDATAASASSSPTSSTLSVNNCGGEAAAREAPAAAEDDDDWPLDRRARKRYRAVAELYEATRPAKRGGGGSKRRRREEIADTAMRIEIGETKRSTLTGLASGMRACV